MLPFESIICPVDFSEPSLTALDAAVELAVHFQARLAVVHAIQPLVYLTMQAAGGLPGPMPVDPTPYQDEQRRSAQDSLAEVVRTRTPPELKAKAVLVEGNPPDMIVQAARERGASLVVIATHGQTGWRRFLFGSVTERVVRLAECPVLTIQPPHRAADKSPD